MDSRRKADKPPSILVVDDDPSVRSLFDFSLRQAGYLPLLAESGEAALERLSEEVVAALVDLSMPGMSGLECLAAIKGRQPDTEVIIVTAARDIGKAVEAMKAGASDYLTKPANLDALIALVGQAVQHHELARENRRLRQAVGGSRPQSAFIGRSPAALALVQHARRVAQLDSTVLITGESGVGKGLLARLIHYDGPRARGPFIAVNCVALPRELIESELFGHEKGAFTGAHERRVGLIEVADGGTLLLDEVGDMPLDLQPKLLTFLQERTFSRVGGTKPIEVDVRVIAATHQDLSQLCRQKRFREDLFYRINVLPLHIPPLRERPDDIPPLVEHLLARIARHRKTKPCHIAPAALRRLLSHPWPGNVRELENVLERATAFCRDETVEPDDLPLDAPPPASPVQPTRETLAGVPLAELERRAILATLQLCNNNKAEAARRLGISEKSIYNKLKRYSPSQS